MYSSMGAFIVVLIYGGAHLSYGSLGALTGRTGLWGRVEFSVTCSPSLSPYSNPFSVWHTDQHISAPELLLFAQYPSLLLSSFSP